MIMKGFDVLQWGKKVDYLIEALLISDHEPGSAASQKTSSAV